VDTDDFLIEMRDRIAAYIEARQLENPVLMGHSLGGVLSLMLAIDKPELPAKLVIVDALPYLPAVQNPTATVASVRPMAEGINQLRRYANQRHLGLPEGNEQLFWTNQLVVATTRERWHERVAEGRVIRTDPRYDTDEAKGLRVDTGITLIVSKGKEPIEVDDWTGKKLSDARKKLTEAGLQVRVTDERHSQDVKEGRIISQTPASGTLHKGDAVKVVVSLGPPYVEIPSVWNKATDDAVKILEDLGLKVKKERAQVYFNGSRAWNTNPGAGERVRKGSTVIVYVV
jgi:hypothetical protein